MSCCAKNICVIRHGYYPSDPRVYKEVRALADAGYQVDVICLSSAGTPSREELDGVRVYRMPHTHRRGSLIRYVFEYALSVLLMSLCLAGLFICRRYRCIQVNTLPDALVFVTGFPRLFGARIVLDMHEPSPELLLTKCNGQVSESSLRLHMLIERFSMRFAHQVLTVNETIRARFIERGAAPKKIAVVRNVPPEEFDRVLPEVAPHDGLTLITHGTLQPRYGQNVVLHALPMIRKVCPQVQLIVAGAGDTLSALQVLAKELHCDDITTFTGHVPRTEIPALIASADIGIVPLLPGPFSELCQPNKLFEYIALKTVAIVSRQPAIEESFDDTCVRYFSAGDVAELAAAVIALAQDPVQRQTLAEQAFDRYQDLKWNVAKQEYVGIIDALLEPSQHSDPVTYGSGRYGS